MISRFAFALIVTVLSGCLLLQSPISSEDRKDARLSKLPDVRSVAEIDRILDQLLEGEAAQQNAETLLNGWGRHGDWYDLAVVKFLWEHWPGAYSDLDLEPKPLMAVVKERVRVQPELNRQVFWYVQWKHGPQKFAQLCRQIGSVAIYDHSIAGEEFRVLLFVAGMTNEPNSILQANWDDLDLHSQITKLQILSKRPFLRFDDKLGHYVVDAEAEEKNQYLDPRLQQAKQKTTPLPNWSSPIVPKSPRRK